MLTQKDVMKYFFVIFVLVIAYVSFLIISPFLSAILTSAVIAYVFYPVYKKLNKKLKNKNLSAFIISLLIVLLIAVPFAFLLNEITQESQFLYLRTKQKFTTGLIFGSECEDGTLCDISNRITEFVEAPKTRYYLEDLIKKLTVYVSEQASRFIISLPNILLGIFVTFFTTFYLFKDGPGLVKRLESLLPITKKQQKELMEHLNEKTEAIVYGTLIVAIIQGAVAGIGYFIFGAASPILFSLLTAFFALVPVFGAGIIWFPLSVVIIIQGTVAESVPVVWKGIGLMLYGLLIVSTIDNIIKPFIIGKKARIHPVLVLLGVLGGIILFGFVGFIIGPLVLALLMSIIHIYEKGNSSK